MFDIIKSNLEHLFYLNLLFLVLGLYGAFVLRRNLLLILISLELMLLSVSLNFVFFSVYLDDAVGQLFSLLILTIAGAESAIGLALLVLYYRKTGAVALEGLSELGG